MKNIIKVLAVVSLVTASSIVPKDWWKQTKVQARQVGQQMGLVKETPMEKMRRGAQQMKEGLVTGWEQLQEELPGQVEQFKEDVTVWGQTAAEKAKRKAQEAKRYLEKQWKKAPWSR